MKKAAGLNVTMHKGTVIGQLYQTEIVKFDCSSQSLTLRNGGWSTMHTKKCLNRILDYFEIDARVFQRKHEWFVSLGDIETPFQDGMQLEVNYKYEVA